MNGVQPQRPVVRSCSDRIGSGGDPSRPPLAAPPPCQRPPRPYQTRDPPRFAVPTLAGHRATTQQPLACGPGPRPWSRAVGSSHPASASASARVGVAPKSLGRRHPRQTETPPLFLVLVLADELSNASDELAGQGDQRVRRLTGRGHHRCPHPDRLDSLRPYPLGVGAEQLVQPTTPGWPTGRTSSGRLRFVWVTGEQKW